MIVMPGSTAKAIPRLVSTVVNDNLLSTSLSYVPDGQQTLFAYFKVQNRVTRSALDDTMIFGPRILLGQCHHRKSAGRPGRDIGLWQLCHRCQLSHRRVGRIAARPARHVLPTGNVLDFAFNFPLTISNLFQGTHESCFLSLKTDARAFENTGRLSILPAQPVTTSTPIVSMSGDVAVPIDPPSPVPLPARPC